MAVSSVAPERAASGPWRSNTPRMNPGSPVESMYVPPAAFAAASAGSPYLANGPDGGEQDVARGDRRRDRAGVGDVGPGPLEAAEPRGEIGQLGLRAPGEHGARAERDEPLGGQAAGVAGRAQQDDAGFHGRDRSRSY